jgi:hypothetical protein
MCLRWDENELPGKEKELIFENKTMSMLYNIPGAPIIIKEVSEIQPDIIDDYYTKVEVVPCVQELKHLSKDEKQTLTQTLKQFPFLFEGGVSVLNIKPIYLELINGVKLYHANPFPVPYSVENTTKK